MGKKRANRKEAYRPPAAEDAPAMKSTVMSRVGIVAIVGYVMLAVLVQVGTHHLVPIHEAGDYDGMRATGALAARTLAHVEPHIQPGVTTAALDAIVRDFIADNGATAATLGYRGYKHSSCISVNEVVCHGVPSTEVTLNAGDIVNVDVTTVLDGWYGDTSKTFVVGGEDASDEANRLVRVTREALKLGLEGCKAGARLGDVTEPIHEHLTRAGYGVVNQFSAHGIGRTFHAAPFIQHGKGRKGRGLLLKPGMFFTVEPMANQGVTATKTLRDGWTAVTKDGKLSAQFEHTVGVVEGGCEVFTRVPGTDAFI